MIRQCLVVIVAFIATSVATGQELTLNQRLVVACHRLDLDGVVATLRDGADVNARFGEGDRKIFQDPWLLGSPIAGNAWTPLIALANASKYPDPPRKVNSTSADTEWAVAQLKKIPANELQQRERVSRTILMILLSHNANPDIDDGYGATPLYEAIYERKTEMAKTLLRYGAKVNTKTRTYIDGPGDVTPLHQAAWSRELTKILLEKGADPKAKDTTGSTPLDWVREEAVRQLYKSR
jgi:ankyrin repeat protein